MIDKKKIRKKDQDLPPKEQTVLRDHSTKKVPIPRTKAGISKALEKYTGIFEDAFSNGDRCGRGILSICEHYQRLLNEVTITESIDEKSVITSEVQATAVNLTSDKPSRTQRALNAKHHRESKVDNSEITKASSGQNNHPNKNRSDNVTSDGIEALKPYEI